MMDSARNNKYFAFISYQRSDEKWAEWLRKKLEHYRLPSSLRKQDNSLPKEIRPVFRDVLELSGGLLTEEIHQALSQSRYLIVICSPHASQSPWVNKEVEAFIQMGRARDIIPFIIEGIPFSDYPATECFTPALRSLKGDGELLGININEMGRDVAAVKVVARMFGLSFDSLWQRYRREQSWKKAIVAVIALSVVVIGFYLFQLNRTVKGQNEVLSLYQEHMRGLSQQWLLLIQEDDSLFHKKNQDIVNSVNEGVSRLSSQDAEVVFQYSSSSLVDSMNVVEVSDGVYDIDGLQFATDKPTDETIRKWIAVSTENCKKTIQRMEERYFIPPAMASGDPCLVYLILNSVSIGSDPERQEWIDLYNLMNDEQLMKLYYILYREKYQLARTKVKYEKKDEEISLKYSQFMSEYQTIRTLAKEHPEFFYDLCAELQDQMLDVYLRYSTGKEGRKTYESLLSEALEDCEIRLKKDVSCKPRLASLKNRLGAFRLNHGRETEAMELFESAYGLDPESSAPFLANGYNKLAYRYAKEGYYSEALETIDKAIDLVPSYANYYDSKGEILLMSGDEQMALDMWNKVLELEPEFLSRFKNGTPLYRQLLELGLI